MCCVVCLIDNSFLCFLLERMVKFLIGLFGSVAVFLSRRSRCFVSVLVVFFLNKFVLNFSRFLILVGVLLLWCCLVNLSVKLNLDVLMLLICRFVFIFGRLSIGLGVFWNVSIIWNSGCFEWE